MFKLYLTQRSVNEATAHYLTLIERAIFNAGQYSKRIFRVNDILKNDIVITVESKDFFLLQILKPRNKKINWFQGINPEEALMMYKNPLRAALWRFFEQVTLRKSSLNIFVSKAMQAHYLTKYGYNSGNYFIMPCYNSPLNPLAFFEKGKYISPSFVYTGSLSSWQCVNQVLLIFKQLQILIPNANLKILTTEREKARLMIKQFDVQNCEVDYVPAKQIGEELKKYKYGFLIREEHIVNTVSTPTKMNTYLANGVIPIYSNVISDFEENINLDHYELRCSPKLVPMEIAQLIYNFEVKVEVEPKQFLELCQTIFNKYYNDKYYTEKLSMVFTNTLFTS